jgi:hypothetical protein
VLYAPASEDAADPPALVALAVEGGYVYVADRARQLVLRVRTDAKATDTPDIVDSTRSTSSMIKVYGDFVYWNEESGIYRRNKNLIDTVEFVAPANARPVAFAVDFYWLYWTSNEFSGGVLNGKVYRSAHHGPNESSIVFSEGWGKLSDIEAGDFVIYFASPGNKEIVELAK